MPAKAEPQFLKNLSGAEVSIIVIDDDIVDIMAVERSFKRLQIRNRIYVAKSGTEALSLLLGTGLVEIPPRPWVILLDLNLPTMSGAEFLSKIRIHKELKSATVFALTTSSANEDRQLMQSLGVTGFISKDSGLKNVLQLLSLLEDCCSITRHSCRAE